MEYRSKYTGVEVDALLDKIAEDNIGDIDSELSTISENPVMNKVITEELSKIPFEKGEGDNSAVLKGSDNIASSNNAIAFGYKTKATGFYSLSEGNTTEASGGYTHAEGANTKAIGNYAHSEGYKSIASGLGSHAEGGFTKFSPSTGVVSHNGGEASGNASHAEGIGTKAQNEAEHASGKYNVSNSDTQFSIGIGTSDANRKNAFEVKQNGDIYVEGVEGRIQDKLNQSIGSSSPMVSVTYAELLELCGNGKLVAGMFYRIIDYVATTRQQDTRSRGYAFDVVVLALDEKTLSEEGKAAYPTFNIHRYKDAYSPSWEARMIYKGEYIYHDVSYHLYESEWQDIQMLVDFNNPLGYEYSPADSYPHVYAPNYIKYLADGDEWIYGGDGEFIGFLTPINLDYFKRASVNLNAWKVWYTISNDSAKFKWADESDGKGVIYRMIDEWGNDCPYDFKSILFKKEVDGEVVFVPTFANESSVISYNNKIAENSRQEGDVLRSYLPFNIMGEGCNNNVLERGANNNEFFDYVQDCHIGCFSTNIKIDSDSSRIYVGDHVENCIISSETYDVRIGSGSSYITFGDMANVVDVGVGCTSVSFDVYSSYVNIIGGVTNLSFVNSANNINVVSTGDYKGFEPQGVSNVFIGKNIQGQIYQKNIFD